jgi:hypothetical protein
MGAWSNGPFDNDTARDWIADWTATGDVSAVEEALRRATESEGSLGTREGELAVAAAAVVAWCIGGGGVPDDVGAALTPYRTAFPTDVVARAHRAVARVSSRGSELRDLWADSGGFDRWTRSLGAIQAALRAASTSGARPR